MNPDDSLYEDPNYQPNERPVPEVFHSFYEDRPFLCCTSCGESLQDLEEPYQITKAFHGTEVILEYAMCSPCQQNLIKELSEESLQRLAQFQMERSLSPENDPVLEHYQCEFCLTDRQECIDANRHFSMAALCCTTDIVDRPLFICEDCRTEIDGKMSQQTKRRWRDFIDTHFPGVPANSLPDPTTVPVL